ncbi:cytochrome P450 [Streptomyces sp. HB2AG]|uniref:cytochrome P450 n=1 Tax=Streptomyces sp. HB2AG TaxID=2983400 RepID=UPI0022AAC8E7|nr:cytochrome P450 [Streptomyces sp. HB2AG]MCZ2524927.1 cytochrome P450 [Streptomyces sp. HB2AG]
MTTTARVPGPAGLPLLGSMFDLQRDSLGTYLRGRAEHGDVVRFTAGPPGLRAEFYGIFSAKGAQQVLAGDSAVFRKDNQFYQEIRESFGNGLLTSQDEDYLRQRRLVQPLFTRRRVDGYADALYTEAAAVAEEWRAAPGSTVDMVEEMTRFTLRAVSRILFGTDIDAAVDVVRRSFPVIGEYALQRGLAPFRLPRTWPTPSNRAAEVAQAELYAVCDRVVSERLAAGTEDRDDLLSLLSRARSEEDGSLDADEIRDQVLIFLLAGHETTATSLTFALHLLGHHPQEQRRAHEEVDRVLGGRPPAASDVDSLPYLTMVLKEAMRLYPPAPVIGRRPVRDVEVCGHIVPAGANVFVAPWVTHRHPAYWEEPERFDPERFTPERESARPRYAWFPFGGGPRACIGQHFSMLESVLALATFLREYELESLDTDVPLKPGITLVADGPARVRLTPRR